MHSSAQPAVAKWVPHRPRGRLNGRGSSFVKQACMNELRSAESSDKVVVAAACL